MLAELELYTPLWSARILAEMSRNLVEDRITAEQAARIEQAMRQAFEDAGVDAAEIDRLEPAMTNDEKDRHVLAAAVAADLELIVTLDLDDFPPQLHYAPGLQRAPGTPRADRQSPRSAWVGLRGLCRP
jgi:predicted nucleic acid-binding protein